MNQDKNEALRKQFWARLFSVTTSKGEAFKQARLIKEKIGLWDWYEATEAQLDQAYRMTNFLYEKNFGMIDSQTEHGFVQTQENNKSSKIL